MRLKIGLLNDSFPPTVDGVANATFNYAQVISSTCGGDCTVITPRYPGVTDDYPFEVFRYRSFPLTKRIGYRAGNPVDFTTIKALRRKNFDLLHVHCPFASSLIAQEIVLGRSKELPVVFTYHTKFRIDINNRVKSEPARQIVRKLVMSNINSANEVWVVSSGAGEDLKALGYTGSYRVMENGADYEHIARNDEQRALFDREWNTRPEELVFLFVGRTMWYKNIRLILDALKILKDRGLDFQMIFVGDGYDLPDIKSYTADLQLSDRTLFTGRITDRQLLRTFFGRADLFLFPSTYDTSGLVVKEAAACDCPSLLVRNSCAAEGVEDGFTGFFCEENAADAALRIEAAVADRQALARVGQNAGEHIYLSWETAVMRAYDRYIEIVESWPHRRSGSDQ